MNLTWRSRLSALCAWGLVGAVLADMALCLLAPGWAFVPSVLGGLALFLVVGLNADLFAFFRRRGGLGFVVKAVGLHTLYLLYSSLVFAILWAEDKLSNKRGRKRGQAIP